MEIIDVAINRKKLVSTARFHGEGSAGATRELYQAEQGRWSTGQVARYARYLGPHLAYNNTCARELEYRKVGMQAAWSRMRGFWSKSKNTRWKSLVFQCIVAGTGTTGMCALAPTKRQYMQLNTQQVKLLRALVGGAQTHQSEEHVTVQTNRQVLRKCKQSWISTQVQMQRIGWLQAMVRIPQHHVQYLAAMFGICEFDKHELAYNQVGKRVAPEEEANPWIKQFNEDVRITKHAGFEYAEEVCVQPSRLFCDEEIRDNFLRVEPKFLAAMAQRSSIGPDGSVQEGEETTRDDFADMGVRESIRCTFLSREVGMEGRQCDYECATQTQLFHHHFKKHGVRGQASVLTLTNKCIACGKFYSSRTYASRHLANSLWFKECRGPGAMVETEYNTKGPYHCALCNRDFEEPEIADAHMQLHLPRDMLILLEAKKGSKQGTPRFGGIREFEEHLCNKYGSLTNWNQEARSNDRLPGNGSNVL